jgi:hypothetical protein
MLAARRAALSLRGLRSLASQTQTKASYDWTDPMNLNAQLTEDERMFRDSAHAFCQQELQPTILKVSSCAACPFRRQTLNPFCFLQANRNEHFDAGLMKKMGEQGLLGATVQGYGCAGVNYVTCLPPPPPPLPSPTSPPLFFYSTKPLLNPLQLRSRGS